MRKRSIVPEQHSRLLLNQRFADYPLVGTQLHVFPLMLDSQQLQMWKLTT